MVRDHVVVLAELIELLGFVAENHFGRVVETRQPRRTAGIADIDGQQVATCR